MQSQLVLYFLLLLIALLSLFLAYYTSQLVLLDAQSRQLKRPKLWAFFVAGSQNGAGLTTYLAKRKQSPLRLTPEEQQRVHQLKRKLTACLVLDVLAFIVAVFLI